MQNPLSSEDQVFMCERFAAKHDWPVEHVAKDEEKTGTLLIKRPGLKALMRLVEDGAIDVLLLEHQDRLTRNQKDLHELFEIAEHAGVVICTIHDGVLDEVRATINGLQASQEIKKLRERVKRGQAGAVRKGSVMGLALGYLVTRSVDQPTGGRIKDPIMAPIVLEAFRDFAAGVSLRKICARINQAGHRTRRGALFRPSSFIGDRKLNTGILRNRAYLGETIWGRTQSKKNMRTGQKRLSPGLVETQEVNHFPELQIVPEDVFDAVQERLLVLGDRRLGDRKRAVYVFSGLLRCGICGSSYAMGPGRLYCSGHLNLGVCENRRGVDRRQLEKAVLAGVSRQIIRPDVLHMCLHEYEAAAKQAREDVAMTAMDSAARVPKLTQAIENITEQLMAGEGKGPAGRILREKLDSLAADLKRAEHAAKANLPKGGDRDAADKIAGRLKVRFERLAEELYGDEREASLARELLRDTIERIVITPVVEEVADGRGAGPVRLQVEGKLGELLKLTGDHEVLMHPSGQIGQNLASPGFLFWLEIPHRKQSGKIGAAHPTSSPLGSPRRPSVRSGRLSRDAEVVATFIRAADKPVRIQEIEDELCASNSSADRSMPSHRNRTRAALRKLIHAGLIACPKGGVHAVYAWLGGVEG